MTPALDPLVVERFRADVDGLVPPSRPLGIAVSGGADSLALLLLAKAARRDDIRALTIDHALRPEAASEARHVAKICARWGIAHDTLRVDWEEGPPARNIEAAAREARYGLVEQWSTRRALDFVATGHHADDQAETMLMRLARGSGLSGLSAIRPERPLGGATLVRPLLGWQRKDLSALVHSAGLKPVHDPMNADPAFDRARLRMALAAAGFDDAPAYASSAAHLGDANAALDWVVKRLWDQVVRSGDRDLVIDDAATFPRELQRRLLLRAFDTLERRAPRGPDLDRALDMLRAGGKTSLGGLLLSANAMRWTLEPAPPRRSG
ncbi:tRNA lysidine(34) synthetase TilS [Sphingomicrobium sp. XHP0235]|uniref:tRNA lysidine(34) synthetase TilS n=1 Tax=Sphingomicrobium aquimarinum TaxID=3133971 RepID=UPI0031FE78E2